MECNKTIISEASSLSHEQLLDEYNRLSKFYTNMKITNEMYLQQVYDLKRSLKTANSTTDYLSQELESITEIHKKELKELNEKNNLLIDEFRTRNSSLLDLKTQLETKIADQENQIAQLSSQMIENDKNKIVEKRLSFSNFDKELELEENISMLNITVEKLNKQLIQSECLNSELKIQNQYLKEENDCLEENLKSKKDDIEEKITLIDSLHEQLIELTTELNELKHCPDSLNKKGNSLFGEVDDQRRLMKDILANHKKEFLKMQKLYRESEYQIRRLKRENATMNNEMQYCISIFTNADKKLELKSNEYVKKLCEQNQNLQNKIELLQRKLSAENNGQSWMETIMSFCENETKELKSNLYSYMMKKAEVDENYRNAEQELARWRFEALQSRCALLNREVLLEENKIKFNKIEFIQLNMTNDHPRIIKNRYFNSNNKLNSLDNLENGNQNNGTIEKSTICYDKGTDDVVVEDNVAENMNIFNCNNTTRDAENLNVFQNIGRHTTVSNNNIKLSVAKENNDITDGMTHLDVLQPTAIVITDPTKDIQPSDMPHIQTTATTNAQKSILKLKPDINIPEKTIYFQESIEEVSGIKETYEEKFLETKSSTKSCSDNTKPNIIFRKIRVPSKEIK